MRVEFDSEKNLRNIEVRGLFFDLVRHLDWATALAVEDTRKDLRRANLRERSRYAEAIKSEDAHEA